MLVRSSTSNRGYSLAEMLVVIAIIGIMSMVSVPMFMTFVRSNKMKSAMRQFTNDLRATRQRAITQNHPTMISFKPGTAANNDRFYRDFDGVVGAGGVVTYTLVQRNPLKELDNITYFRPSSDSCMFADVVVSPAETAGWNDIVFLPNGTIQNIPTGACTSATGKVFITTDYDVPTRTLLPKTYTIEGYPTGQVKAK